MGVVFQLDRSSRNVGDFSLLDKLTTKEGKNRGDRGRVWHRRSAGRLAFRNFCNMCVWYSENLSEEVTTKWWRFWERDITQPKPRLGIGQGSKDKMTTGKKYPDSAVAPFVKESFWAVRHGNYSIRTLCDYMRKRAWPTATEECSARVFERMLEIPLPRANNVE